MTFDERNIGCASDATLIPTDRLKGLLVAYWSQIMGCKMEIMRQEAVSTFPIVLFIDLYEIGPAQSTEQNNIHFLTEVHSDFALSKQKR